MTEFLFVSLLIIPPIAEGARDTVGRPSALRVDVLDEKGFSHLVSDRHGKSLVLNVWATWCEPCVEEFPDFGRVQEEFRDKDVEFVAVSIDDRDDLSAKVIPFLSRQRPGVRYFINGFKKDDGFINTLNLKWSGAVPATFFFDSTGKQRSFVIGRQSLESFRTAVSRLISP